MGHAIANSDIASSGAKYLNELGNKVKVGDLTYKCYKAGANFSAGAMVYVNPSDLTQIVGYASGLRNMPAGRVNATVTSGDGVYVQTWGAATIPTDGGDDIAAGDTLIMANGANVVDSVTAGTASTYRPVGIALAADSDSANTVAGYLTIEE